MTLKNTWANGEQFTATDANAVATAVNASYTKPGTGIPSTDLASDVQTSLGKADSAVQSVSSTSITDATTTGKAVLVATDAATARTALGVAYGTSSGTVAQGNDSRFTPASTSISDSTSTGRALLTTTDASTARTTLGVAYGTSSGTVAQGNDSRITGAQQTSEKGNANGYASLDSGGKVPIGQLPSSIMEYQGVWNASTNSPTLADGTGSPGDVYRVSVAGSRNLGSGSISFAVGDYCVMNSSNVWEKSDTTDAVSSVAGRTGDITLAAADVSGVVASGGALGTPSSGTLTNCTGLPVGGISATGSASSTTYLRGDGSWQTVTAGINRSVSTITSPTTLASTASTDYVYFLNYSSTDSDFGSVLTLLHGDGSNNSTTITDSSLTTPTWSASGNAKLNTTTKKYGSASISFDGTNSYITPTSTITMPFSGDWTIEFWFYLNSTSGAQILLDCRPLASEGAYPTIYMNGTAPTFFHSSSARITGSALTTSTWYHLAVSRSGTSTKMFINGTQSGSTYTDSTTYSNGGANRPIIGSGGVGSLSSYLNGFVDDVRITSGVARYTTTFTAPTAALPDATVATPTLPTAASNTNMYRLKNILPSMSITVGTTSSQTIDGASSYTLTAGSNLAVISDGSNWRTI